MCVSRTKKIVLAVCAAVLFVLAYLGASPRLFVYGETELIASKPAFAGETVQIRFIHSVQKTPVEEFLVISDDLTELVLKSTRYHSFGVGLPFLGSEGAFYQDGNDFVMDNMDRHFGSLSLRTGLGTQLTLTVDGEVYPLYEKFAPGHKIDIFIAPGIYGIEAFVQNFLRR